MNTSYQNRSLSTEFADCATVAVSRQTQQLVALGRERGWDFRVLGQAPMLAEPVRLGDWLLVPVEDDSSSVPTRTLERVQALFMEGVRLQGFVLVHEAPLLLAAPGSAQANTLRLPTLSPKVRSALKVAAGTLGTAAIGLGVLAGTAALAVAAISVAAVLALPLALFAGVTLVDPILVAVTEDDYWVEIDRWSS